eukprot:gene19508-25404_t
MNEDKPLQKIDDFVKTNGYSYDFVLVYHVFDEDERNGKFTAFQLKYSMREVIELLTLAQLQTSYFYSCQRDEVYIKIRATPERIKFEASRVKYRLLLDHLRLRAKTATGAKSEGKWIWKPFVLDDTERLSPLSPYHYIYGAYDNNPDLQSLYKNYSITDTIKSIFKPIDRIKLIISIINAKPSDGGAGLPLNDMVLKEVIMAAMPLHDYEELKALQKRWLILWAYPWDQPVDDIKDYFGERIALYFLYLQHYVTLLMIPAVLGFITYSVQVVFVKPENFLMPYFTGFMVLWSTFFIEFWKQRQSDAAMRWGVVGFEEEEQDRPQFEGKSTSSPVDGSDTTYFPSEESFKRYVYVNFIIFMMLCGVILIVAAIFTFQYFVVSNPTAFPSIGGISLGTTIVSLLNAVVIAVLNYVYINVAIYWNDYENHRTDTVYEDALITKIFTFQLVNSFAALTYVSFIKSYIGGIYCTKDNCIGDAATTLSTVFLSSLITRAIVEVIVRKFLQDKKEEEETSGLLPGVEPTPIEQQYVLNEYELINGTLQDYAGLVMQYGFTVLFVGAFPLAPTLAFISGYIQIRIDGWKLCQAHRRPIPKIAEDIGTWQLMIEVLSLLGDYRWEVRWLLFLTAEHITFVIKYVLAEVIDDIPETVQMQTDRSEFLVSKVLQNVEDDLEVDDVIDESQRQHSNIIIYETDLDWTDPIGSDYSNNSAIM